MISVTSPLTLALAKALGVYMIAAGGSGLITPKRWRAIMDGLKDNPALDYYAGILVLTIGLVMILAHNIWTDPLAILITLIGWGAAAEGVLLLLIPEPFVKMGVSMLRPGAVRPFAVGAVAFGALLLAAGLFGRAGG